MTRTRRLPPTTLELADPTRKTASVAGLYRHGGRTVPGRTTSERDGRARLRRHAGPRGRRHRPRRGQPARGRDPAAGPGRDRRSRRGVADRHRNVAGGHPRLGVPALTRPPAGRERGVARLRAPPIRARAPRAIPAIGLIGAPLLAASATATLFGISDQVSAVSAVAALPIALWELSLGTWLVVRGFRRPVHVEPSG
jgi:hypothetical protein